jgi:hypothetical protein
VFWFRWHRHQTERQPRDRPYRKVPLARHGTHGNRLS